MAEVERKGLRFEVYPSQVLSHMADGGSHGLVPVHLTEWQWTMVGADGPIAKSFTTYDSEKECRSALAANKGRLGNAKRAKVITLDTEPDDYHA